MLQQCLASMLVNMELKSSEGFVVWLAPPGHGAKVGLRGTVEHTGTSERIEFNSGEALLDFMAATLEPDDNESAAGR